LTVQVVGDRRFGYVNGIVANEDLGHGLKAGPDQKFLLFHLDGCVHRAITGGTAVAFRVQLVAAVAGTNVLVLVAVVCLVVIHI